MHMHCQFLSSLIMLVWAACYFNELGLNLTMSIINSCFFFPPKTQTFVWILLIWQLLAVSIVWFLKEKYIVVRFISTYWKMINYLRICKMVFFIMFEIWNKRYITIEEDHSVTFLNINFNPISSIIYIFCLNGINKYLLFLFIKKISFHTSFF